MALTKRAVSTSAAVMAAAATLIVTWEGVRTKPYRDIVGVKTVCVGATAAENVDLNRDYTYAECLSMLQASLKKYDDGFMRCIKRDIPDSVHIAGISFTYNVGIAGACSSSFVRKANAGDFRGACDALLMWNRAGGRVVKGLDNRRRSERKVCLEGL